MRILRIVLAALLTGTLLLYGCVEDKTPVGSKPIPDAFPNAVGMLWVYEVYDSLAQTLDTVMISVTDSLDMSGHLPGLQWRMYWTIGDSVVDRYVIVKGDTVEFLADTTAEPTHLEHLVYPIELGAQWTGPSFADTSRVTDTGTASVPAGNFMGSAYIERSWEIDFEGGGKRSETWIAPNVGIVYRYLRCRYSDGAQIHVTKNQTWDLIRYDLSTFPLGMFPNAVGTQWVYEVTDTGIGAPPETVTVNVESRVSISWADSATLWTVLGNDISELRYVAVEGNRVHILYDTIIGPFYDKYYDFPLAVGRHWGIESFVPVPIIDDKGMISVPAGQFASAFHYTAAGGALNDYWVDDEWLVPGTGMVFAIHSRFGLGPWYTREWTLLRHEITN